MTTTPPAPTVTPHATADPCPRVEVLITPMPADARTVTVWRSYAGVREVVRGASNADTAGDFLVVDYEAPLQRDVAYACQTADLGGVPSETSEPSSVVDLDVADAWASDPLAPATSMPWPLSTPDGGADLIGKQPMFSQLTYSADQATAATVGSALPIGMSGVRRAAAQIPLAVVTYGDDAAGTLLALFGQAFPLLVRTPAAVKLLPPLNYLMVGDVTPAVDPGGDRIVWSATGDSVTPPGISVVIPLRDYDDLASEAATYDGLAALYATYIDMQRGN